MAIVASHNRSQHAILLILLKSATNQWIASLGGPLGKLLGFEPQLLVGRGVGDVLLAGLDLDPELGTITHAELQLALVLYEDLQNVLDFEQAVVGRISEQLDHVAQLWVQLVHIAKFLLVIWDHELDSPSFSDFFSASIVLMRFKILFERE